jgi:hypothetical protein
MAFLSTSVRVVSRCFTNGEKIRVILTQNGRTYHWSERTLFSAKSIFWTFPQVSRRHYFNWQLYVCTCSMVTRGGFWWGGHENLKKWVFSILDGRYTEVMKGTWERGLIGNKTLNPFSKKRKLVGRSRVKQWPPSFIGSKLSLEFIWTERHFLPTQHFPGVRFDWFQYSLWRKHCKTECSSTDN